MPSMGWNGGIIGKRNTVAAGEISGIWNLNKQYNEIKKFSWRDGLYGAVYSRTYLVSSGGNLITAQPGSLNAYIDSASDGDVILCPEGNYTLGALYQSTLVSDPFRGKNILICGKTDDPGKVFIEIDHYAGGTVRDHPLFHATGLTPSVYRQFAFVSVKRLRTSATSYENSFNRTEGNLGRMINCYIDNNNGDASWNYDNNNTTTVDVKYLRCTFANVNNWDSKYSGRSDVIDVGNCLFEDVSIQDTQFADLGGNITGATINTSERTYNTQLYPTAGHLYVPNLDVVL